MQYEIYTTPKPKISSEVEWRWRLIKIYGNVVIAHSAQVFETIEDCEKNIHLVMLADYSTPIVNLSNTQKDNFMSGLINRPKPDKQENN